MTSLSVVGWERWQTYRKGRGTPPWIKIYRNLLSNPEWAELTDAEKGQLVSIWIVAADKEGHITANEKALQKICQLDEKPNINKFIGLGFLAAEGCQHGATVATTWRQHGTPETETEKEKETDKTLPAKKTASRFADFWNEWPTGYKIGKKPCRAKWKARNLDSMADTLIADVKNRKANHQKWLDGFIENPLTYLNQDRWHDDIQTKEQVRPGLPKRNEELVAWARSRGIDTRAGESWDELRARCERESRMH